MTYDYDILIAGGGLVGGSLALALENTALRVGLIEARTETERLALESGQRALALSRGTCQILKGLGVWSGCQQHASPIRHIHVSEQGRFGKTRLHASDMGVDALGHVMVARYLEEALSNRLQSSPGCHRLCPAHVMGLKASPAGMCVTLKQGRETLNLTTRLLVAADGGNSTVRRLLDIPQRRREYGQTALVAEVVTARHNYHTAYERFTPSGPLALLPLSEQVSAVVWTLSHADAEDLLQQPETVFMARLQAAFGHWLGRLQLKVPPRAFPLELILTEQMTAERVVFIGNALHQLHPVAGQGFNLGLRDAAVLADHLATRQALGADPGQAEGLARFAAARKRDLEPVIRFTDGLVRLFVSDWPTLGVARSAAMTLLDCLPPVKRYLARQAMGYGVRI